MKFLRISRIFRILLASSLLLTGALIGLSVSPTPVALATCDDDTWCLSTTPSVSGVNNQLYDVAAVSDDDVWAVGYSYTSGLTTALAMHYNGLGWVTTTLPITGTYSSSLYGVAVVDEDDVWAVGDYSPTSNDPELTFIIHWTGSEWEKVESPNESEDDNVLNAVAVVTASNIWAVGFYVDEEEVTRTLIQHWNGTDWQTIISPDESETSNILYGVTVVNATNVWASGVYEDGGSGAKTLVMQWDGSEWNTVPSPNPGSGLTLYKIDAITQDDVWSVGAFYYTGTINYKTLTENWDGDDWNHVSSPNTSTGQNYLKGVSAMESDYVWAVGSGNSATLTERWDGGAWEIVSSPNVDNSSGNTLLAVSVVPGSSITNGGYTWAIGSYFDVSTSKRKTMAMVYHNPALAR